jgi:hypothetical protein
MYVLTTKEKHTKLAEIIPSMCNIISGYIGPELYVTTVGVLTPDGIAALPPFMAVDNIIEHYWSSIVDAKATVVIDAGKPEQRAYSYGEDKWVEDTGLNLTGKPQSNVLRLGDLSL